MFFALPLNIAGSLGDTFKIANLGVFISSVISVGITIAAVASLLYLLWGGFDWLTSGGDKTALENARNKITQAIIGLAIVVAVWAIFGLVQTFLGVSITREKGSFFPAGGGNVSAPAVNQGGAGPDYNLFRCPGPNCDRCPGGTRAVDKNDPRWQINSGC